MDYGAALFPLAAQESGSTLAACSSHRGYWGKDYAGHTTRPPQTNVVNYRRSVDAPFAIRDEHSAKTSSAPSKRVKPISRGGQNRACARRLPRNDRMRTARRALHAAHGRAAKIVASRFCEAGKTALLPVDSREMTGCHFRDKQHQQTNNPPHLLRGSNIDCNYHDSPS